MALIKCSECGNEISTQATSCPKCGAKPKKSVGVIGIIIAVTVLVVVVKSALNSPPPDAATEPQLSTAPAKPRHARVNEETMREATTALEASIASAAAENTESKKAGR